MADREELPRPTRRAGSRQTHGKDSQLRALCFHSHRRMTTALRYAPLLHKARTVLHIKPSHRLLLSSGQTTRETRGRKEAQVNIHSRFLKDITVKSESFVMRTGWPGRLYCLCSLPPDIRRFPAINFLFWFCFFLSTDSSSADRLL